MDILSIPLEDGDEVMSANVHGDRLLVVTKQGGLFEVQASAGGARSVERMTDAVPSIDDGHTTPVGGVGRVDPPAGRVRRPTLTAQ